MEETWTRGLIWLAMKCRAFAAEDRDTCGAMALSPLNMLVAAEAKPMLTVTDVAAFTRR